MDIDKIYDIVALRVIVDTVEDEDLHLTLKKLTGNTITFAMNSLPVPANTAISEG